MTDETLPASNAAPAPDAAGYAPPGPVYAAPPPSPGYAPPPSGFPYTPIQGQGTGYAVERPGRTLGIVGFILSFFWVLDIAGLIISIVGLVKSRRAGQKSGFALAGIIISIVGVVFLGSVVAVAVPTLVHAGQVCSQLGNGVHVVGNATYTCTPTSFNVTTTQ
jgi:hypothetical protein